MKPVNFYDPDDSNGYLSNFYATDILFDSQIWPSAEHLYQSFKFLDGPLRQELAALPTAQEAFDFSRKHAEQVRSDWPTHKRASMFITCANKFFQNNQLRDRLINSRGVIQENSPCDTYWGKNKAGEGKNNLGRILSVIRHRLRQLQKHYGNLGTCFLPIADRTHLLISFEIDHRDNFIIFTGAHRQSDDLLCRVHSECATGDLLGSQKCDCGQQLTYSLGEILSSKYGALAYLRQEGRGIGLVAKARAYEHQWYGQNTIEANISVGHEIDERSYECIMPLFRCLKPKSIELITNNPDKLDAFRSGSNTPIQRRPTRPVMNPHNKLYLDVKNRILNHDICYIADPSV